MKDFPDMEYIKAICKIGQGHSCCRYLTMSSGGSTVAEPGWSCEKHSSLAVILDARVVSKQMNARGDNCEGKESKT